jgi:hypothetical protein
MTIRNILVTAASAIALTTLATSAMAAGTVSQTATASAQVVSPYTLTKTTDMLFGMVTRTTTGTDTFVLSDTDTITKAVSSTGNGAVVTSPVSTARFQLSGVPTTYSTTQVITGITGLTVTAATPTVSSGTFGTIPAAATQELKVGGQITVSSATVAQIYSGTLTLTVNYN